MAKMSKNSKEGIPSAVRSGEGVAACQKHAEVGDVLTAVRWEMGLWTCRGGE